MRALPKAGDVADLLRLPSVLSVPGDVLLGAAASGRREPLLRVAGSSAASSCLYLAGMALNDYADRKIDAEERPARPIPSGRIRPRFALRLAIGLTAAGLGCAAAAGGRRALSVALPLATTVWVYDLAAKETFLGPTTMAMARFLDVFMGAGTLNSRRSLPAALIVGGHTFLITTVSRQEARGGTPAVALGAVAGTAAVSAAAARLALRRSGTRRSDILPYSVRSGVAIGLLGVHAASMGEAELAAMREPSAANFQRVVGTGVLGLMPLEAGMLAALGSSVKAALLAAGWRFARRLAQRRSVT